MATGGAQVGHRSPPHRPGIQEATKEIPLIVLGGTPFGAEFLTDHLLRGDRGSSRSRAGRAPSWLSHHRASSARQARGARASCPAAEVVLVASFPAGGRCHPLLGPVATPAGALLAVYDLGGGLSMSLRCASPMADRDRGHPEGMNQFGGWISTKRCWPTSRLRSATSRWTRSPGFRNRRRSAALRFSCREAKRTSRRIRMSWFVMLPEFHTQVRLTRGEFEEMVRPRVEETLVVLGRVILSVGSFEEYPGATRGRRLARFR